MKYKEGDKVRIKTNLIPDERYGGSTFVSQMLEFIGKETTINVAYHDGYCLEVDRERGSWKWTGEMLEPVSEYPKEMLVTSYAGQTSRRTVVAYEPNLEYPYLTEHLHIKNAYTGFKYAKDLPQPKELTMQEIADKFGISVEQLKIKK